MSEELLLVKLIERSRGNRESEDILKGILKCLEVKREGAHLENHRYFRCWREVKGSEEAGA